ncbi:MAG: tRNA/rRNA methyltransferase (SpoU) [Acidimicrobiales bacterium]|nr:tRNA/rRNA methyltransferase (SpoU) [Acidimicrobiales bacterium]
MAVRAVTFDADETLWDFPAAMWGALDHVIAAAEAARPELAGRLVAADLQTLRDRLADEAEVARGRPVLLAAVRRASFHVAMEEAGSDDPALADELADLYFRHRHGDIRLYDDVPEVLATLAERYVLGLVTNGSTDPETAGLPGVFAFRLAADVIGIAKPDARLFEMAAAAAECRPAELVHVGDLLDKDVVAPQRAGARGVWLNRSGLECPPGITPDATIATLAELPALLAGWDAIGAEREPPGVGPHPAPWPDDPRLDPELLAGGDRRNVVDRYRYWRHDAIVADLDTRRHPFHVAVENWHHDLNIGTVVRNANAFGAAAVHIVGRRRWNRRGAMVTDRYLTVHHHATIDALVGWAHAEQLPIVAIDNLPGAQPLESTALPERCVLLFGQEGPGLSPTAHAAVDLVCSIAQFGSTRSINAGVASGIAMHTWVRQHAEVVDRPSGSFAPGPPPG